MLFAIALLVFVGLVLLVRRLRAEGRASDRLLAATNRVLELGPFWEPGDEEARREAEMEMRAAMRDAGFPEVS
jgi:hypothetical protein